MDRRPNRAGTLAPAQFFTGFFCNKLQVSGHFPCKRLRETAQFFAKFEAAIIIGLKKKK